MARELVTKSPRFYCVSLAPDLCKTPIGAATPPIPYVIKGEFSLATGVSRSVKSNDHPVVIADSSVIPSVTGDEPGIAKGVKSGTVGQRVQHDERSKSMTVQGEKVIRNGDQVKMNDDNTKGKVFERGGQAAKPEITPKASPNPPPVEPDFGDKVDQVVFQAADKINAGKQWAADQANAFGQTQIGSRVMGGLQWLSDKTELTAVRQWKERLQQQTMDTVDQIGGRKAGAIGSITVAALEFVPTSLMDLVPGGGKAAGAAGKVAGAANRLDNAVPLAAKNAPAVKPTPASPATPSAAAGTKADSGPASGSSKNSSNSNPASTSSSKPAPRTKANGARASQKKRRRRKDKKDNCCPKNGAPGGKSKQLPRPVDLATGEEILPQIDFVIDGAQPFEWLRTYRSGSEHEDWGLLGARWATPYTMSIYVVPQGWVLVDQDGRAVRFPSLAIGKSFDHRAEGVIATRRSADTLELCWRDGSRAHFVRGPDRWLPHGWAAINIMEPAGAPQSAAHYRLVRSENGFGQGVSIEHLADVPDNGVLLTLRSDGGIVLACLRAPGGLWPRIGSIERIHSSGVRETLVRYDYATEASAALPSNPATPPEHPFAPPPEAAPHPAFASLPTRHNLIRQTDANGHQREYAYAHHLLIRYTTYGGFAHTLSWRALAVFQAQWDGNPLSDTELALWLPITANNSYRARAVETGTSDGSQCYDIHYPDIDHTELLEPDGLRYRYSFDDNWLATQVLRLDKNGSTTSLGRREWDEDGFLLAETDALGNTKRYRYDRAGNLIATTDALGHTTHLTWTAQNRIESITDPLGGSTRFAYDEAGRLARSTDALGHTTQHEYDAKGQLVLLMDAKGGKHRFEYDASGNLVSKTDCSGKREEFVYDANGRLCTHRDALGQRTAWQFDAAGRVTRQTAADGSIEHWQYDIEGNVLAHTDAAGRSTRFRYNGQGLPVERIDAKGQHSHYRFDAALRLREIINGNDESYRFTWGEHGGLVEETGFDGKTTRYQHDAAGQVIASEAAGKRIDFIRDAEGKLIGKSCGDEFLQFEYDALGRMIGQRARHSMERYRYDALGRLTEQRTRIEFDPMAVPTPGLPQECKGLAFVMRHEYDELGNRSATILPNGRKMSIQRYGSGHWHGVLWQGQTLVDVERDDLHRERERSIGPASPPSPGRPDARLLRTRVYDPRSRLSSTRLTGGSEPVSPHGQERHYQYDPVGNLLQVLDPLRGARSYQYDAIDQLIEARQGMIHEWFEFDAAGNVRDRQPNMNYERRIQTRPGAARSDAARPDAARTGLHAERRVLAHITRNLLGKYRQHHYAFDPAGNITEKHTRFNQSPAVNIGLALEYDAQNQLIGAVNRSKRGVETARYVYDGFGRRIAKQVQREGPGFGAKQVSTTWFVWDGDVLQQEIGEDHSLTYVYEPDSFVPLAHIRSEGGVAQHRGQAVHVEADAVRLPLCAGDALEPARTWRSLREQTHHAAAHASALQAAHDAGRDVIHYYDCDHLGTPLALLTEGGKTVWSADTTAWGRVWQEPVKQISQPLRFQGQYQDDETLLHYNRYRYYDPDTGRFITQDPIGLMGGENLYQYAANPVGWVDPLGLERKKQKNEQRIYTSDCAPLIKQGSKEWQVAIQEMRSGNGPFGTGRTINYRVESLNDARALRQAAFPNMPKMRTYTREMYRYGYEEHPLNKREFEAKNYYEHLKWTDNGREGHIYYGARNCPI